MNRNIWLQLKLLGKSLHLSIFQEWWFLCSAFQFPFSDQTASFLSISLIFICLVFLQQLFCCWRLIFRVTFCTYLCLSLASQWNSCPFLNFSSHRSTHSQVGPKPHWFCLSIFPQPLFLPQADISFLLNFIFLSLDCHAWCVLFRVDQRVYSSLFLWFSIRLVNDYWFIPIQQFSFPQHAHLSQVASKVFSLFQSGSRVHMLVLLIIWTSYSKLFYYLWMWLLHFLLCQTEFLWLPIHLSCFSFLILLLSLLFPVTLSSCSKLKTTFSSFIFAVPAHRFSTLLHVTQSCWNPNLSAKFLFLSLVPH